MRNEIIMKSGIDLNAQENMIKIYNYLDNLKQNNENFLDYIRFSKRQIDQKKLYIINPIEISDICQNCKDMAFLYNESNEIIGHVYSKISKQRIGFVENMGVSVKYASAMHEYDSYIPEFIDKKDLLSKYLEKRVENEYEIEYGAYKYEKKI